MLKIMVSVNNSPSAEADSPRENHNVKTLVASLVGLGTKLCLFGRNRSP